MSATGIVLDKDRVREILTQLVERTRFSPGALGIEQATNTIMAEQRPPANMDEVALTVSCNYCGRTAGNPCRRSETNVRPHPSRMQRAIDASATADLG